MNLRTISGIHPFVTVVLVMSTGMAIAQTEILTFDDLPNPGTGEPLVPNGYGGIETWEQVRYVDGVTSTPATGIDNAVVSPSNVAFDAGGSAATLKNPIVGLTFNLNSAYLTGIWNDGLQVEVKGYTNRGFTYDNTYTVNTTGPTFIDFNYVGLVEADFIPTGGTPNPAYSAHGGGQEFTMDNLSITLVPEPSSISMFGTGLCGVCFLRRLSSTMRSIKILDWRSSTA